MGQLINGQWTKSSVITSDKSGAFVRKESHFRHWISQTENFKPESSRYHLYVSYACPWAHRVLIMRELKELNKHISVDVVHPDMMENGWSFDSNFENATGDTLYKKKYLYEIYQLCSDNVSTKVTVPILWDKNTQQIVNNESSEILRIFNSSFNHITQNDLDFYPSDLQDEIDEINDEIYININNGVYKTGFAKTQSAYDEAVKNLFNSLDKIEEKLNNNNYLVGNQLTEADIRLVTTLLRFDNVYHYHFKCNLKKIADYKNLSKYLNQFRNLDCIKKTTFDDHIKRHYFFSHESINPTRIIPIGPIIS